VCCFQWLLTASYDTCLVRGRTQQQRHQIALNEVGAVRRELTAATDGPGERVREQDRDDPRNDVNNGDSRSAVSARLKIADSRNERGASDECYCLECKNLSDM
jgi:hypothetical protein